MRTVRSQSRKRWLGTAMILATVTLLAPGLAEAKHGKSGPRWSDGHHSRSHRGYHDRGHYRGHRHPSDRHWRHDYRPRYDFRGSLRYRHGDRDHRSGHHYQRHFVIPRRIYPHDLHGYRPYYHSRIYYEPHHHHHLVYSFPVYGEYGVIYQPYAYCGERLFAGGYFHGGGPHFSFHIRF